MSKERRKPPKMKKHRMNTSKAILLVDFVVAILLTVAVTFGSYLEKDMSQVVAIAVGWDAQLAVAVGAYYWKAKNENRSKYAMNLVEKLADKYGIDSVISLAEVILKE